MKRSSGWNQEVTDAQGRRRFHGAFTGGFSAGYYNSVGTEEGWQPSTFESSRASRSARPGAQRAEDFMDEEDDPLLGKRLETAEAYDTLQTSARQRVKDGILNASSDAKRREMAVLLVPDELVLPTGGDSIGKKLLSQMGWKEGHGIGPKLRRKLILEEAHGQEDRNDDVLVPPRNTIDVKVFPKPKLDKYGAGFDPFVDAPEFLRHKQQQNGDTKATPARQIVTFAQALGAGGASRVAMGFGLSALEDNDDLDVYGTTSMDEFDRAIAPAGESVKLLDSMSSHARDKKRQRDYEASARLCSDGRPALPGFRIASKKETLPQSVSQRLEVPSEFRAYHVFDEREEASSIGSLYGKFNFSTEKSGRGSTMTAKLRAQILDEGSPKMTAPVSASTGLGSSTGSVFDMMDPAQREKLMGAAKAAKERKPLTQGAPSEQFRANVSASIAKRFVSASTTEGGDEDTTTASSGGISTVKKSYRTESDWAPHVLLCKRFHVKCQGRTISGGKDTSEDVGQDLFTKELAPHLLDFAAAGRQAADNERESTAVASLDDKAKRGDDKEALPPLPVAPKPSTDLLRSIFEPSDESAAEEEDSDEDGHTEESEKDGAPPSDHSSAAQESHLDVATAATDPARSHDLAEDSESSSSDDLESSDDEPKKKRKRSDKLEDRSPKKHKKAKHKKDKDSKKSKKMKTKKAKKSTHSHSDRESSSRSSRRDRVSRRSRSRSRSRDRKRSRDRSRDRK